MSLSQTARGDIGALGKAATALPLSVAIGVTWLIPLLHYRKILSAAPLGSD